MPNSLTKRQLIESLFNEDQTLINQSATVIVKLAKKQLGIDVTDNYVSSIRKEYRNFSCEIQPKVELRPISMALLKIAFEDAQQVAAFAKTIGGIDKLMLIVTELQVITKGL